LDMRDRRDKLGDKSSAKTAQQSMVNLCKLRVKLALAVAGLEAVTHGESGGGQNAAPDNAKTICWRGILCVLGGFLVQLALGSYYR
jgi:hypothetical protein